MDVGVKTVVSLVILGVVLFIGLSMLDFTQPQAKLSLPDSTIATVDCCACSSEAVSIEQKPEEDAKGKPDLDKNTKPDSDKKSEKDQKKEDQKKEDQKKEEDQKKQQDLNKDQEKKEAVEPMIIPYAPRDVACHQKIFRRQPFCNKHPAEISLSAFDCQWTFRRTKGVVQLCCGDYCMGMSDPKGVSELIKRTSTSSVESFWEEHEEECEMTAESTKGQKYSGPISTYLPDGKADDNCTFVSRDKPLKLYEGPLNAVEAGNCLRDLNLYPHQRNFTDALAYQSPKLIAIGIHGKYWSHTDHWHAGKNVIDHRFYLCNFREKVLGPLQRAGHTVHVYLAGIHTEHEDDVVRDYQAKGAFFKDSYGLQRIYEQNWRLFQMMDDTIKTEYPGRQAYDIAVSTRFDLSFMYEWTTLVFPTDKMMVLSWTQLGTVDDTWAAWTGKFVPYAYDFFEHYHKVGAPTGTHMHDFMSNIDQFHNAPDRVQASSGADVHFVYPGLRCNLACGNMPWYTFPEFTLAMRWPKPHDDSHGGCFWPCEPNNYFQDKF